MSSTGTPIRVALVNDYEIIVEGLREMLKPFTDRVRVVETVAGDTPDKACDIALFDTFAGRRHALARVRAMLADHDIAKVVLYTWDAPTAFLDDVAAMPRRRCHPQVRDGNPLGRITRTCPPRRADQPAELAQPPSPHRAHRA